MTVLQPEWRKSICWSSGGMDRTKSRPHSHQGTSESPLWCNRDTILTNSGRKVGDAEEKTVDPVGAFPGCGIIEPFGDVGVDGEGEEEAFEVGLISAGVSGRVGADVVKVIWYYLSFSGDTEQGERKQGSEESESRHFYNYQHSTSSLFLPEQET
ncbi:hypothetical protein SLA2020_057350 [Shorea laevis]